ncbi:hypothetical protein QYF61_013259 [Mycteria americana]|uniref:Uncharacterized protein n=1 Tax=Mycteria americana TaxID=33587 RepID=A0AAN7PHK8_MYCAM|nr:hypothetical protein QYF61_013259 [Mycteria americana]
MGSWAVGRMDSLLAKAKPIGDAGGTSVITYLRKGKNNSCERGMRKCERNSPTNTKVSEEGGGAGTPGAGAEIPLQPVEKTVVMQVVPLQLMEDHSGGDIHIAAHGGLHGRAGVCALKKAVTPSAHTGAGSWQDLWPIKRSPHRSSLSGRTCGPVGDPCWSSPCLKDCTPWKEPMLEQFLKNCSPWEGPMLEKFIKDPTLDQRRSVRRKERQRQHIECNLRGPKLNTVFEVRPHPGRVQGHDHFPSPAGHAISDTSQDAVGFLGCLGTLLAHIQAPVNQHPQVLLCQAAFQPLFPKPVALHGVAVAQVQDLALGLVKPHTIDLGPSIQPVQVPLQSLPTLKQINTPVQIGVICKLTEGALDPFIQVIDKDVKQNWPQH